jgi:hypothetical protein
MPSLRARPGFLALTGASVALLTAAVAAWPAAHRATRTYSTGSFVVNCTSSGQVCSPPERLRLTPPRHGTMTSVRYTTSAQHCSAVVLQVVRGGRVLATSGRLEAGERTETFTTSIHVRKGPSNIGFRAKGFTGGCNAGRVGSWGGRITVTVRLAR